MYVLAIKKLLYVVVCVWRKLSGDTTQQRWIITTDLITFI